MCSLLLETFVILSVLYPQNLEITCELRMAAAIPNSFLGHFLGVIGSRGKRLDFHPSNIINSPSTRLQLTGYFSIRRKDSLRASDVLNAEKILTESRSFKPHDLPETFSTVSTIPSTSKCSRETAG